MADVSPFENQNPQQEDEAVEPYTDREVEDESVELYTDSEAVQVITEELGSTTNGKASGPSKCCPDASGVDAEDSKAVESSTGEYSQEGYNYAMVDVSLQQDFQCSICHLIPSAPAKVSCCGHIFCYACITSHQSRQSECPLCRKSTFEFMIDKLQKRKIQALSVRCVNHEKGCEWTGELREMQQHLQRVNTEGIKRCQYQLTTCKKCDKELIYNELSHHMDNVCEQRIVDCDYNNAGCNFKATQVNMLKHIHEEAAMHLQLSLKQLRKERCRYQHKYWMALFAVAIMAIFVLVLFGSFMFIFSKRMTEDHEAIEHLQIGLNEKDLDREIEILQADVLQQKIEVANLRFAVNDLRSGFTKYIDDAIKSVKDFLIPRFLSSSAT